MSIERKRIVKRFLLLCEGEDAEEFLINYLNSDKNCQTVSVKFKKGIAYEQ